MQTLPGAFLPRPRKSAPCTCSPCTGQAQGLARLDVVTGNLPAERLYQKHSFLFCEERKVYYEDTGEICVRLYERELT